MPDEPLDDTLTRSSGAASSAVLTLAAARAACFAAFGSTPSAISTLALSARWRASLRPMRGKGPMVYLRSAPLSQKRRIHGRTPLGKTTIRTPVLVSAISYCLGPGASKS